MELKIYEAEMLNELLEIYSYYVEESAFTFDLSVPSPEEFHEKLLHSHVCLVLVIDGHAKGFAYGARHRAKAAYDTVCETSIYLATDIQRGGYGKLLYSALLAMLEKIGIYTALGGITNPNPGSEALHQRLGFEKRYSYEKIGYKHGAWQDVDWWRKDLKPFDAAPEPLRGIDQVSAEEIKKILDTFTS